ncbi:hypothetical protein [Longimicrobium sp.]|jgi:hypothetical protein|uniref:hypothetical protein n=1 Tax=Longimicrobium sp. TaxID=2029185 RepID=UPI002EDAFA24
MIPGTALFKDALRYSRTVVTEMDILYGDRVLENDVPVVTGSVSTDRTRNTRYEASVEMAMYPWDSLPLNALGTRVELRYGLSSIGTKEVVPVGEYQVFDYKRTNRGSLSLTLKGLENYVIESTFLSPRTPPYGMSTITAIKNLVREVGALKNVEFVVLCSRDKKVQATAPWDTDRWAAITQLATSIQAEVWAGHDGRFYITDMPVLSKLVSAFQVAGGEGGVLVDESRSSTRDQVYNAVSVSGTSSDTETPPVYAYAFDNRPDSPTYFYGPYGQRVRYYSSQFFTTAAQCQNYANLLLGESLATNNTLSIGALPIPFLEGGDAVRIVSEQDPGRVETFLIQKTALGMGTGAWSADVLTTNEDFSNNDGQQNGVG